MTEPPSEPQPQPEPPDSFSEPPLQSAASPFTGSSSEPAPEPEEPHERPTGWLAPGAQLPSSSVPFPPPPPPAPRAPSYRAAFPTGVQARHLPRRRLSPRTWFTVVPLLLLLPLGLLIVVSLIVTLVTGGDLTPDKPTRSSVDLPTRDASVLWSLSPAQLRPDLGQAEYLPSIDGSFDQSYVAPVGGLWLAATAAKDSKDASDAALHAVDVATGQVRWQRRLDGVLCATEAPTSGLLCASVLDRDPATHLGTRWRLHLLDPATGRDRATRDVDAWLTAVHWVQGSFVLLQQREPAPHAVVSAVSDTDLRPRWTRDLVGEKGQAELFTDNRVIRRAEPDRPGLALDRPRFRDVGKGLVAVWAGQRTAFVGAADGKLVMMPHCSRLVDDGSRLWCNEVDGVSAYAYDGRPLFRVRGPRLAFPTDDGVGADRIQPVFLDEDGAGVAVDPKTGAVGPAYTPPGIGSAFGTVTMPSAYTVGPRTFLVGEAGAMLVDPVRHRVIWRNEDITTADLPLVVGGTVLVGDSRLDVLDLRTGQASVRVRTAGLYTVAVGNRIAALGPDLLSLVTV